MFPTRRLIFKSKKFSDINNITFITKYEMECMFSFWDTSNKINGCIIIANKVFLVVLTDDGS